MPLLGSNIRLPYEPEQEDLLGHFFGKQELGQQLEQQQMDKAGRVPEFSRPIVPKEEQEQLEPAATVQNVSAEREFNTYKGSGYWGDDPSWQKLSNYEKAAAMALMEADVVDGRPDVGSARNVLGAMINRADRDGVDLGVHVSTRIYQPTIEPVQYSRLAKITKLPEFQALRNLAQQRDEGLVDDWVGGATHFLAHEPVMERLQAAEPGKYRSWVDWTGYKGNNGQYANPDGSPVFRDRSHAFLAPEGRHSANRAPLVDVEGHQYLPSDVKPPTLEEKVGLTRPSSGQPATKATTAAGSKVGGKLPSLSQALFGVEKPVLGNMLGMAIEPTGKFANPMSSTTSEASAMTLPGSQPVEDQQQQAFVLPQRQRRPAPEPYRRRS